MAHFIANSQIHRHPLAFLLLIIFVCFSSEEGLAQSYTTRNKKAISYYREADNFRVRRQYRQCIELLEMAVKKDDEFAEAWFMLGVVQSQLGSTVKAIAALENSLRNYPPEKVPFMLYRDLGSLHFQLDQLEEAKRYTEIYLDKERTKQEERAAAYKLLADIDFTRNYTGQVYDAQMEVLQKPLNQFEMQYFPTMTADQKSILFTKRTYNTDEDIVISTRESLEDEWSEPKSISPNINTADNEGTCSISGDGKTMVFTACSKTRGVGGCDLYISKKVGEEWSVPENMGVVVNSPAWDSQPSLSADGRTIYFVSTRKGSLGGRDIWSTNYDELKGKWSKPENLGNPINTVHDEVSPFIHPNNQTLYFASKGHPGFGGMDIFSTEKLGSSQRINKNSKWTNPENLGKPVNSKDDQVSLFITADGERGYFSWEDQGGVGLNSRLVTFLMPEELKPETRANYVFGRVRDKKTGDFLAAEVELFNLSEQELVFKVFSDSLNGEYLMVLPQADSFSIYVEKNGYLFEQLSFKYDSIDSQSPIRKDVYLEKTASGNSLVLQNIFFDLDSYELKKQSEVELNIVSKYLKNNPGIKISIVGHTDNTGDESYNLRLSKQRAQTVYNYLKISGISPDRLLYKGQGSKKPITENTTEEGRAMNRRIEMEIR